MRCFATYGKAVFSLRRQLLNRLSAGCDPFDSIAAATSFGDATARGC